mgnify:CR=1 FL=1
MWHTLLALLLLAGVTPFAWAQQTAPRDDASTTAPACEIGVVSVIFIDNHSIFDMTDPERERRFDWAYRLANALHVRTRAEVIERELLVRKGDCLDPMLLEESERLLRAYPFLSRVDVFAIPQPDGTHHVVVDTQDEWSTQVDLRIGLNDGLDFSGLRLRELNLLGTGRMLEFFYLEDDENREYGIGYETPQLFRTRWDMRLAAGRSRAGSFVRQSVAYPFVGEVGRWAARQSLRREDRFFGYAPARANANQLLLPVAEKEVEFALIGRSGRVGALTTYGAAISYTGLAYPGGESAIEWEGTDGFAAVDEATAAAIRRQRTELESLRLLFLVGRRNIEWIKRRGLDSMRGQQDVRLGTEVELAIGGSLPGSSDDEGDLFTGVSLYGGVELGSFLVTSRLNVDGRRDFGAQHSAQAWKDIFADAEALIYWRPGSAARHTFVLRVAGTGGWETRTPFQLTLGGDLGLRGYDRLHFPGGQRALLSLEDRVYFGWPFRDVLDLGGTLFLDVGRVWPGDVPFGVDSGWRAAAGLGLRGSFPSGGRTTYRIDLAWPLTHGASWRDARLVLSIGEILGIGSRRGDDRRRDDRQLQPTAEAFHFPR